MKRGLSQAVEGVPPGACSLVMATCIVAVSAAQQEMESVTRGLHACNEALYLLLIVLTVLRVVFFPRRVWEDITTARRALSLFIVAAATCIMAATSSCSPATERQDSFSVKTLWSGSLLQLRDP